MDLARLRPTFASDYAAAARAYGLDLVASTFLFFSATIMAGRVWRFPFDDELIALSPIERSHSAIELISFYLKGGDIHPPLSFLMFYGLQHLGLSEAGMRLVSVAMTAVSLILFHLIALVLLARRNGEPVAMPTRLIAVLLFALCPLALGQGDAIRWYPVFALLVALFVTFYLFGNNDAARLWAAVPLGLAASTNFLAVLVAAPLAIYRYGLQRRFCLAFDGAFAIVVVLFASLGLVSAGAVAVMRFGSAMHSEFAVGPLRAALTNALGVFGGDALGLSQAWILIPVVAVALLAMLSAIDRKQPADPLHLLLLMLAAAALMALPGFAKPRSFLYLAPVVTVLLTLFLDRQVRPRGAGVAVLLVILVLAPSIAAIANINGGTHPFKRNSASPYQSIIDFIATNGTANDLVIATDPVVPWLLRHKENSGGCASQFINNRDCFAAGRRYDSIFVITGHNDGSDKPRFMDGFRNTVDGLIVGRRKVATIHAGIDKDAALKTWLTGVPLGEAILTVDLYR
jgi:hypothetical protein